VRFLRTAAVGVLALTLAGCVSRTSGSAGSVPSGDGPTSTSESIECEYQRNESSADRFIGLPPEDESIDATSLTLTTSAGEITIELDAEQAPCTVRSMAFLAEEGFYDGTSCHRLTASQGLKVLQCGDPNGDGTGGPGYTIPDELDSTSGLTPSADGQTVVYGRGIAAMANAGPDTGGSQFFLVYGDSTIPPSYTVFGTVDPAGLATLDQIAAGGIVPGEYGPEDGTPATPVGITKAQVS
jgi:peptidyl-prolyl cis-trans isomerase B (cyclophilin B)